MITYESNLKYNNSGYGKGTAYIAKLSKNTTDPTHEFEREFMPRKTEYIKNSKTTWYEYSWDIKIDGLYEFVERNNFKRDETLYIIVFNNGTESMDINKKYVIKMLEENVIEINDEINKMKKEFKDDEEIFFTDYNIYGQYAIKKEESNQFVFDYIENVKKIFAQLIEHYKDDDMKQHKILKTLKIIHDIVNK